MVYNNPMSILKCSPSLFTVPSARHSVEDVEAQPAFPPLSLSLPLLASSSIMAAPSSSTNHISVSSPTHLQSLLSLDLSRVSVLYFRADWAEPCVQMDSVIAELSKRWSGVLFLSVSSRGRRLGCREGKGRVAWLMMMLVHRARQIEAESLPDISESFEVDAVPYFILLRVSSCPVTLTLRGAPRQSGEGDADCRAFLSVFRSSPCDSLATLW